MADTADHLEWEQRQRPKAAVLAGVSGTLMIAGLLVGSLAGRDQPTSSVLDPLSRLEAPGSISSQPSARVEQLQFAADHSASSLASYLCLSLGLVGLGLTLFFLARCTSARRPIPRVASSAAVVGAVFAGVGLVVVFIINNANTKDLLDGARTVGAVSERPEAEGIGYLVQLVGFFAFALGAILVSLNAMRAGLLTRTMGILGMFAGGAVVFSGPAQPLTPLWTVFLAPLLLGRWPGGQPPAWVTGNAEPWPSAAQQREERLRARGQARNEPEPEVVEERAGTSRPHPSSKKRKRKRRA